MSAIDGHYPFIAVTVVFPLVLSSYTIARHLARALLRGRAEDPYDTPYNVGLILLAGSLPMSLFLYKGAFDSTYLRYSVTPFGSGWYVWDMITGPEDLELLLAIVEGLRPYFALAGLGIGLSLVPVLLRRLHGYWLIEAPLLAAPPLLFVVLELRPLRNMKFATGAYRAGIAVPGTTPYELYVEKTLVPSLLEGLLLGISISAVVYLVVRWRAGRGIGSRRA